MSLGYSPTRSSLKVCSRKELIEQSRLPNSGFPYDCYSIQRNSLPFEIFHELSRVHARSISIQQDVFLILLGIKTMKVFRLNSDFIVYLNHHLWRIMFRCTIRFLILWILASLLTCFWLLSEWLLCFLSWGSILGIVGRMAENSCIFGITTAAVAVIVIVNSIWWIISTQITGNSIVSIPWEPVIVKLSFVLIIRILVDLFFKTPSWCETTLRFVLLWALMVKFNWGYPCMRVIIFILPIFMNRCSATRTLVIE